ncbi:MAG: aminotransferase class I/II-fold pyridoxal phosphate-dependent enzyme [Acidobacteriota bacterium]
MKLEPFQMERLQSTWEHAVDCNLSESGVHPVRLGELVPEAEMREQLLGLELGYPQTNGTPELRSAIASMYCGATPENVLVVTGTAEANFLAGGLLLEPGDQMVLMLPNYMQLWGLGRSLGAEVTPFHLLEERAWSPDLRGLENVISSQTRVIAVCNPNNPTGAILTESEMTRIVAAADRTGAWLLADEVYRGAELDGKRTPSFWGLYDRTVITSGLSKAYGLPGLRIGWMVSSPDMIEQAWGYRDYTTIAASAASDFLARLALRADNRERLLNRTRHLLKSNYPLLRSWVDGHSDLLSLTDPKAGAIAYLRYRLDIPSEKLVETLRKEKSVLVVPGAHFLMEHYLRIGYGCVPQQLEEGLGRIGAFLSACVEGCCR